ncbi:uncharacterized mitochondrial protein AtMg00810-like [Lycium ferocissimum]|uniref:uncharacterized mitochondrial protein AtMg00810-like n=1 Tax=Lycium ferocissimum TaxID=112874 RepID=UPI0028165118|nr:uncharacterized mitochondrial protein AtMg00810-like [Lycium ferocissimum]
MVTVRTVLSLAAAKGWHIHQMDVYNAFLQGHLHDEIYIDMPQGFHNQGENLVCRLILEIKTALQNAFKMKDLGKLKYFLGIEFARSSKGITMNKRKYALELISEARLATSKPANTPIDINVKLTSRQYDETFKDKVCIGEDPSTDQIETFSQFLQDPKKSPIDAALRIVRYIKKQPGQGLLLSSKFRNEITAFCDVDWASCPITRRSITGFMIKFGDSLVSWKSKKRTIVSRRSAESEYRSMTTTVAELT